MRKRAKGIPRTPPPEPRDLVDGIPDEYLDVLQTIELMLVATWRADPRIDDSIVEASLVATIDAQTGEGELVTKLTAGLNAARASRPNLPPAAWRDSLRTVLESVRRHSTRRPGDCGYLRFVSPFLP